MHQTGLQSNRVELQPTCMAFAGSLFFIFFSTAPCQSNGRSLAEHPTTGRRTLTIARSVCRAHSIYITLAHTNERAIF